jgi:sugar lactone lactonase YvrE
LYCVATTETLSFLLELNMLNFVTVLQAILGVSLLLSALLFLRRPSTARWLGFTLTGRFAKASAVMFVLAGAGVLVGIAVPFLTFFTALLAACSTLLLWFLPSLRKYGLRLLLAPGLALGVSLLVGLLQPLGLRVMLLPRADTLPYEPAPAALIKTYEEGLGFESVRAGPDGTLYLSANRGLDFTSGAYYRSATGQLIARSPNGEERVLFTTPVGSTAGVIAVANDGTLYLTSHGRQSGIWRIPVTGKARMIARLPEGAWPNGLDFGPDGKLYAADSALAVVWRIDPVDGRFEIALRHKALAARRFIALAPGANGIHFRGQEMIVTVSDAATVLSFQRHRDGSFGPPKVLATGIPGDDFAIGPDGSLFITTHPYDTVVRLAPDGRRSVVGNASQHVVGATDATFGRGPDDRAILYVVTDGGAFTNGPTSRGQLIALQPIQGT